MKHCFERNKLNAAILTVSTLASILFISGCSSGEEREAKYFNRALSAFESGDYDKARVDIKNVLQINNSNAEARLLIAKLEERQQNWSQMYANLTAAVESDPTLWEARVKLAELLVAGNQIDQANEQIDAVLDKQPEHADALAVRAGIRFREGNLAEAELLCQKILAKTPGHLTATGMLAAIYGNSDPQKAIATIEEGIRLNPGNTTLQLLRIQFLAKLGDSDRVVKAFEELIEQNPDAIVYPARLASYLNSLGKPAEAEQVLRAMLQRNPDSDQSKLLLIDFLTQTGEPARALEEMTQFSADSTDNFQLRSALARLQMALGKFDEAKKTLQFAIDKDPRSADALNARTMLADLALKRDERPVADKLLAEILDIEPGNVDALLIRARLNFADNDPEGAIADLRTILKSSPNSAPALELLALAQERTGADSLALDSYQQLLQLNGSNLAGLSGAARLLVAQGKLDDAKKLLDQAHKLAPNSLDITRQMVELLTRQKQWKPALEMSQGLLLKQETAAAGHYLMGQVLRQEGSAPKAIEAFQNSLNLEPRGIEPLQALLATYIADNQLDTAITYAEKHIKRYPDHAHAHELLAALYKQNKRFAESEKILREIIEKHPSRISAYRELSSVLIASKQQEKVAPLLEMGLEKNPENTGLTLMLAEVYQSEGKYDKSLALYEQLLTLMPKSEVVRNNLAILLIENSPKEEDLRRALQLTADFSRSENPMFLDTLGWIHVKNGNYPQAIPLLEDAVRRHPVNELRYHLGVAYMHSKMVDKAREQLKLALEGDTPFPWRRDAEKALNQLL